MEIFNQILNMNAGGAYGGGKVGGAFDPLAFIIKPQIVIRVLCWKLCGCAHYMKTKRRKKNKKNDKISFSLEIISNLNFLLLLLTFFIKLYIATINVFSIVVFGCISSEGWHEDADGRAKCLFNDDGMACKFGNTVGVFGFLASIVFIISEFLFERMSSVKSRRRFVMIDMGFSAFWAFMYVIAFVYLWSQWSSAEMPPGGIGVTNMQASIVFCFFSIFTWALCALIAYKRFLIGAGDEFTSAFENDPANVVHQQTYASYSIDNDNDQYNQSPFTAQQTGLEQHQQPQMDFQQQPTY